MHNNKAGQTSNKKVKMCQGHTDIFAFESIWSRLMSYSGQWIVDKKSRVADKLWRLERLCGLWMWSGPSLDAAESASWRIYSQEVFSLETCSSAELQQRRNSWFQTTINRTFVMSQRVPTPRSCCSLAGGHSRPDDEAALLKQSKDLIGWISFNWNPNVQRFFLDFEH